MLLRNTKRLYATSLRFISCWLRHFPRKIPTRKIYLSIHSQKKVSFFLVFSVSVSLVSAPTCVGARSAVVPLFLLLCTSAGRIVALLLIQLTTPSLFSKRGSSSSSGVSSPIPHLSSTARCDTSPGTAHVDRLAPEEENTTLDEGVRPSLDQASLERRTRDDEKREVVSERNTSAGRRKKEEKDENVCLMRMMNAGRKASFLSFLHCLFIMVPITVLVQVYVIAGLHIYIYIIHMYIISAYLLLVLRLSVYVKCCLHFSPGGAYLLFPLPLLRLLPLRLFLLLL